MEKFTSVLSEVKVSTLVKGDKLTELAVLLTELVIPCYIHCMAE
jgi:hypothetical protein